MTYRNKGIQTDFHENLVLQLLTFPAAQQKHCYLGQSVQFPTGPKNICLISEITFRNRYFSWPAFLKIIDIKHLLASSICQAWIFIIPIPCSHPHLCKGHTTCAQLRDDTWWHLTEIAWVSVSHLPHRIPFSSVQVLKNQNYSALEQFLLCSLEGTIAVQWWCLYPGNVAN